MENGSFGGGNGGPNNGNNGNNKGGGGNNNNGSRGNRNGQMIMMFVLITLVALLFMSLISKWQTQMTAKEITYTEFMEMVEKGEVESVELNAQQIDIMPKKNGDEMLAISYYTGYVGDDELVSILKEANISIKEANHESEEILIYPAGGPDAGGGLHRLRRQGGQ